ncbi:MAG: sugar ABC transporter substrate-binding protein [Acidobacteria bacterium]|nr:MAG: sugar ABC transporter substrate-binding protein [Acidobacteriota bacterium]
MSRSARLLHLLAPCALAILIVGCGGSPHSVDERFFLIATNIQLPYWQAAGAGLSRAATQMQIKADFVGPDTYDPKAQQEAFRKALTQKPTGILISPADPDLMKADIDQAIAQGIPVITIDSDAPASKRLLFIGTNNYKAGQIGGEVLAKRLGKGNVIVFGMPKQANLRERLHGYQDTLAAYPPIKIVEVVDIQGDPRVAFDKAMEIMDKRAAKVDAFACLEAIACPEVAEVLDRKKAEKVVVAMDAEPRTLEWIQKGRISATIGQKPYTMAYYGLRMLDDLHHHKITPLDANWEQDSFSPIPTFVDTGTTLIDKSNVEAFLKARDSATVKR